MTAPKNPKPVGLPITIPAAEALANLERSSQMDIERAARRSGASKLMVTMHALKPAEGALFGSPAPQQRPPTKAEREAAAVHASYMVGDTTPSKVDLSVKDIPGPMLLEVTAIDCYDHNPRIFANEKFEDIEASLRANGFHDALVVTRRRVDDRYMLAAGSNTTLKILQELWRTTGDEKYRWVNCIFQPFESDAQLIAKHLGENMNRGDMRFWEIAKGMVALLDQLEIEQQQKEPGAKSLTLRDQAELLTVRGLRTTKSQVALWRFAVQYLSPLESALPQLTARAVHDHIQPRTNAIKGLAAKFKFDEPKFLHSLFDPVLRSYGSTHNGEDEGSPFDAASLCDQLEAHFAESVGESLISVRQMLSMLKLAPALTLADLRMPNVVGRGASSAPAPAPDDEDQPPSPVASTPPQANLPLGPAQVRGAGVNPPASAPRPSPPPAASAPPPASGTQQPTPAAGELFGMAEGSTDPLRALHAAVEALLAQVGLSDTLRWRDEMPLGFFVEIPDPAIHARRQVALGSPEFEARTIKTVVWWSLVLMTGQFRDGCVPYIDRSSVFFRHYSQDTEANPLTGTDIEESAPEIDELLMHRLTPGRTREAMHLLRQVEEAAAAMFAALPERWRRMLEVRRPN